MAIVSAALSRLMAPLPLGEGLGVGAAVSIGASGINAGLGLWLRRLGRHLGSPALEADGAHVLTDVVTTCGVLVGIGVARLTGWWILDPLIAIAVACQIVFTGWRIVRDSIGGLMDEAVPFETRARLEKSISEAMDGALEFHDLRARRAGVRLFVELHLVVPGTMTVADSHAVCDRIEQAIQASQRSADVVIHVEPESERQGR